MGELRWHIPKNHRRAINRCIDPHFPPSDLNWSRRQRIAIDTGWLAASGIDRSNCSISFYDTMSPISEKVIEKSKNIYEK